MFKSIRWKFILVYFLLVFIAMVIVGLFIVGKFETQQLAYRKNIMTKQIESIISSSSYLSDPDWEKNSKEIQDTVNDWRFDVSETLYIISGEKIPRVIATSYVDYQVVNGTNALVQKAIDPSLVFESANGERVERDREDLNGNGVFKHIAYPVLDVNGKVRGILYMTSDLSDIYKTLDDSKNILINATMLALLITVFLGFFIASSITEPIRDVTEKAEKMAKGDFNQFVDLKSDDEIGQLANMFNYLTLKLKDTIEEIDLERAKLDTIFKYMDDGVIAIDRGNNLIHANPVAKRILDLGDELNDRFKEEIIDLKEIDYKDLSTLEGDRIVDLAEDTYRIRYAPFRNEKNIIGGIIIVFQDITEQHKLNNMRREFVANVSHELKTPITTIKSYTETLIGYDDLDKDTSVRFLGVIDEECDRMNRIVKDLLQLSNMDYNKVKWEMVRTNISSIVENVVFKLQMAAGEKNQTLNLSLDHKLPEIPVDRDGLEQVISNIVYNAIKYNDPAGIIDVSTYESKGNIVIRVKDNGPGIPRDDLDRIFERFYRVDKGRSRDLGGTGLGLSIAQQIIREHKGDIIIESEDGLGTEVEILLPIIC